MKKQRTQEELNLIKASWFVDKDSQLRWKRKPVGGHVGMLVGMTEVTGRHRVCMLNVNKKQKSFVESNVIWFLRTGEWPTSVIDHIDGNPRNNNPENMRLCEQSDNLCNSVLRSDNKSGCKGVYERNGKWVAQIWKNKKSFFLGVYESFDLAKQARLSAMQKLHREYAFEGVR